jgi:hypothetical protein
MFMGSLVQLDSDDYRPNTRYVSLLGDCIIQAPGKPGEGAGSSGREDCGFGKFGNLFNHERRGREGSGTDEALGALSEYDLDLVSGGG